MQQSEPLHLVSPVLAGTLVPELASAIRRRALSAILVLVEAGVPPHAAVLALPKSSDYCGSWCYNGTLRTFASCLTNEVLEVLVDRRIGRLDHSPNRRDTEQATED